MHEIDEKGVLHIGMDAIREMHRWVGKLKTHGLAACLF